MTHLSRKFGFAGRAPHVTVENNYFILNKTRSSTPVKEDILPSYRNKQLMLWFCNKGNKYQVALYPGFSNITETFTPDSYIPASLIINIPYYIQRI